MFAIAIDGPAGAGKSSVAKAAAKELGFTYVDTGAIYRTIALYMLENGVDIEDPAAVTKALPGVEVSLEYGESGQRTLLGGRDVSGEIRTQKVSMATSKWVAHIPEVRAFLVEVQRELAKKHNVVMDGRDIGTVILPGAQLKVFLTASAEERARRRTLQLEEAGEQADFREVLREVVQRDRQDSAQLDLRPEDGVILDTTGLSFRQVVQELTSMARGRMENKAGGSE
ncbi:(d)CMP kinase [Acutalibacter sp. 1XD8-36]|uniref:(d)CMP kinase n=1 Tax=Acutalibacter sp. 1XD8-36 TaxID=2320852 RepID=UPI001412D5BD|nr:(d)CMP kinase [Acutalibacter sp. 1XD8-36]NBJ90389.1 (d)CMP kinase [Acutalibacter sp. 1XD8-36]